MHGQSNDFAKAGAKTLRSAMTDCEKKLWSRLRGSQLGVKFRKQHPFEDYILDFVCLDRKLIVEVDGSQHIERQESDEKRTKILESAGFKVLRFWNNEVLEQTDEVVEKIWHVLNNPSPPRPSP